MGNILQARGLCKVFDENNKNMILKNVDIDILEGEFVAIMGQSGSGKSTLLYNISGMDKMSSGKVKFDNQDISNLTEEKMSQIRLHKMGFIFQNSHLIKNMCIKDNIVLPGFKAMEKPKKEVLKEANRLMNKLGIEAVGNHDITQVSGGQLQRAAICRALINHPKILFADEPTGALNSGSTLEVMDILNTINSEGTTIMLVTHDAKVAARADRVVYFADGKIDAQIQLGRYNKKANNLVTREEKLSVWLKERGF